MRKNPGGHGRCQYRMLLAALLFGGSSAARAETLYDNGPPDQAHGSAMTHWIEADDMKFGAAIRLESIKFWSFEFSGGFTGRIVWQIYSNSANNSPGTLLDTGSAINLTHVATGFILGGGVREFVNTFDINPVNLPAGTYWLALHNGPPSTDPGRDRDNFFWEATANPKMAPSYAREAPYGGYWGSNAYPGLPSDLAFQINGVVAPVTTAFTSNEGVAKISFTTTAGRYYQVEYKNSPTEVSWTAVVGAERIAGTGGVVQVSDNDPALRTVRQRYYRALLL